MTTGSFCSGIAAPEVAWKPLGWKAKWFSEIDPFASSVLAQRHPGVTNHGDMTKLKGVELEPVDVCVAGTPCQSFSVAGLRAGLANPRGNLALEFLGLLDRLRPVWMVWENVPGVLSSWSDAEAGEDGSRWQSNDFDTFLCGLSELGYGWAWRVLDAQHFGVPQRRRRVFVVGYLGDWRRAAAVLFERYCLSGDSAPCREAGARVAASLTRGADSNGKGGYAGRRREDDFNVIANALDAHMGMGGPDDNSAQAYHLIADTGGGISRCLNAGGMGRLDFETETLIPVTGGFFDDADSPIIPIQEVGKRCGKDRPQNGCGIGNDGDPMFTLQSSAQHAIAFDTAQITSRVSRTRAEPGLPASTLNQSGQMSVAYQCHGSNVGPRGTLRAGDDAGGGVPFIGGGTYVRRLTPRECERLQGFPDDYTNVIHGGKPAADSPRYRSLGNSMAVPVLRWIGERIEMVNALSPSPATIDGRGR